MKFVLKEIMLKNTESMRKIIGFVRRATDDYKMINDGDKIAVGLSGGKDSLTLLAALALYRKFSPQKFELAAITIDIGFPGSPPDAFDKLKAFCEELEVPYYIEKSSIGDVVFNIRKEENPCSLCAKMRRGALCGKCVEIGANKLALGHNREDVIETFFLSLIYEGRLSTFMPVSLMDKTGITLIRPLIYAPEGEVVAVTRKMSFPVLESACPVNHHTSREYMKDLCKHITKDIPIAKERIFSAIVHSERAVLFPPREEENK